MSARARKMRASLTSATVWPSRSKSSRTIIRARSSRFRARRRASAASCATSSRWARGPSARLTRCASGLLPKIVRGSARASRAAVDASSTANGNVNDEASFATREGARDPQSTKSEIANNRRLFAGVVSGIAHYGNCFRHSDGRGRSVFRQNLRGQSAGERILSRRVAA